MSITSEVQVCTDLTPVVMGAYLASRILLKRWKLKRDLEGCLYALADSVRSIEAVSILRWNFIIERLLESKGSNAAAQVTRQSVAVLDTISSMYLDPELERERLLLRVSQFNH